MSISNLILPDLNKSWANLSVNSIIANSMIAEGDLAVDILQADDETFIQVIDDLYIDSGKELRVDTIRENTGLNSVEFPTNLKSDLIEGIATTEVQINDLLNQQINTRRVLLEGTENELLVQQPVAFVLNDEHCEYTFNFTNIDNSAFKELDTPVAVNAGSATYVPQLNGVRFQNQQDGVYILNFNVINTTTLVAADIYAVKVSNATSGKVIGYFTHNVGSQTAISDYDISGSCFQKFADNDEIKLEMKLINGVSVNKNFSGDIIITRIK